METTEIIIDETDARLRFVSAALCRGGQKVRAYDANAKYYDRVVIFAPNKKLSDLSAENFMNSKIFVGSAAESQKCEFSERGSTVICYSESESFTVKNAVLTAEALLILAAQTGTTSLFEQKFMVLGLGRIGKSLCSMMNRLSLDYAAATFSAEELESSFIFAKETYFGEEIFENMSRYNTIINTIPKKLFTKENAECVSHGSRVIDAASTHCADENTFLNAEYIPAPALPAKYFPESAAKLIYQFVTGEKNGDTTR